VDPVTLVYSVAFSISDRFAEDQREVSATLSDMYAEAGKVGLTLRDPHTITVTHGVGVGGWRYCMDWKV
jgi:hypothetical protein